MQVQPAAFEELDHLVDLADSRYDRAEAGTPLRLVAQCYRWVRGRPRF